MAVNIIPAAKMNGLGNEILIMDLRNQHDSAAMTSEQDAINNRYQLEPWLVRQLAQNPQTAFDQIMALYDPILQEEGAPFIVEIWNNDGTKAKACGNGTRCLTEYMWRELASRNQKTSKTFQFATKGGLVLATRRLDGLVSVNMGPAHFSPELIGLNFTPDDIDYVPLAQILPDSQEMLSQFAAFPQNAAILSIGNPHAVFFLEETEKDAEDAPISNDLNAWPLAEFGATIEKSPVFEDGVNVSLAEIIDQHTINLRVFERGAGLTKACGTAACATAIAALRRSIAANPVAINLPGGTLSIAYKDEYCLMTGPTEFESAGRINLETGAFEKLQ